MIDQAIHTKAKSYYKLEPTKKIIVTQGLEIKIKRYFNYC